MMRTVCYIYLCHFSISYIDTWLTGGGSEPGMFGAYVSHRVCLH